MPPKHVPFLIMQDDLCYNDEAIAAALGVKRPSVRSMRSRIKGRESRTHRGTFYQITHRKLSPLSS